MSIADDVTLAEEHGRTVALGLVSPLPQITLARLHRIQAKMMHLATLVTEPQFNALRTQMGTMDEEGLDRLIVAAQSGDLFAAPVRKPQPHSGPNRRQRRKPRHR